MEPINFPESNKILSKPTNMTDEECQPLHVFCNGRECISCWQPSEQERKDIADGKPVYLRSFSGHTQSPVWLGTEYPFIRPGTVIDDTGEEMTDEKKEAAKRFFDHIKDFETCSDHEDD